MAASGILSSTNPYTEIAMRRLSTVLIATTLALGLPLMAAAHDDDIDKINGTARVEAGQHAGDVSSVNGSVEIGDNAVVQKASTVNGSVELGDKAQASEVGTVNGEITLGASTRVRGEVNAVNGHIHLGQGADVGGKLDNVNGAIELDAAHVAGGIETVSGDITVGANSHVEGGILVDKPSGWFHSNSRNPVIVIGPHAVVQGTLEFRREVELKVSDSAQIGPVKGATPVKFSGATP
jgi:UDP-3-O-[3-hydroxymyristoyl] glucosamine N-acyltransferase